MKQILVSLLVALAAYVAPAQWQLQTTLTGNPPLYSVCTVSDRVAWVGSFDTLYRTTDGGANWASTAATPTSTEDVVCIEALSATTAFVGGGGPNSGGGNASIYRTTNGGQNWSIVYTATGAASYWNAIHFFDAQNGIAHSDPPNPGSSYLIVKSTNAGATWTPIANQPTGGTGIQHMYFFDAMHGWFGTSDGRVFRTTDGGNNWTGHESGNFSRVYGVQFVSPQVGIRISYTSPFITRSTDGGQTWATVANLPLSNIEYMLSSTGVNTPSGNQIWVDGLTQANERYVLTSVDGGITWQQQVFPALPPGHFPYLNAVSFGALNDSVRVFGATINFSTFASGGEILSYRQRIGLVTGAYEHTGLSNDYSLSQNYPNPFNPTTTIRFVVEANSHTSLRVYDILGREVATLVNEKKPAGSYSVSWDARQTNGGQATGMASGVYFYRLSAGQFSAIKKLVLLH